MSNKKNNDEDIPKFKIVLIGNSDVGKSSILKRFISGKFETKTISSIGFGSFNKEIELKNGTKIILNVIDTAGQENYKALSASYIKNADGFLLIFSHNNKKSFEDLHDWVTYIKGNANFDFTEELPIYLVGNNCEFESEIPKEDIEVFKTEQKLCGYIDVSPKEGTNIEELFFDFGEKLFKNYGNRKKGTNAKLFGKKKKKKNICILI